MGGMRVFADQRLYLVSTSLALFQKGALTGWNIFPLQNLQIANQRRKRGSQVMGYARHQFVASSFYPVGIFLLGMKDFLISSIS